MYKVKYTENGLDKQEVCKVDDLGKVLTDLRARGITSFHLQDENEINHSDTGDKSNIFN